MRQFPPSIIKIFSILLITKVFGQPPQRYETQSDSLQTAILIDHLRNNFDDIHDVSMRYHHKDHTLNGVIVIGLNWDKGELISYYVERNDTNDEGFPISLAQAMEKWYIKDLAGPFHINLPLNIQIVGNTDSTFSQKGIYTGEIVDTENSPLYRTKLSFYSLGNEVDSLISIYSNREGIFVKTLIPVGNWNIKFEADGYESKFLENISFTEGEHKRDKITLNKLPVN